MSATISNTQPRNAEVAAWQEYRSAVLAMKKRPTRENARKAVLCWKRYFDEVLREAQQ